MAVLGFVPEGDGAELTAAGAWLFRDMVVLPGLLGLGCGADSVPVEISLSQRPDRPRSDRSCLFHAQWQKLANDHRYFCS